MPARTSRRARGVFALLVLGTTVLSGVAGAQPVALTDLGPAIGTLAEPAVVRAAVDPATVSPRLSDPIWTRDGLWALPPLAEGVQTPGVVDDIPFGPAVWDPSSDSWFTATAGMIVRLDEDGTKAVFVDDVQGTDIDVRARARVAVWREQGARVVLLRLGPATGGAAGAVPSSSVGATKTTLFEGQGFFGPRLSPTGDAVLVSESRGAEGHVWVVRLADGRARDLGVGYGPTWHPDGRHVLFARVKDDGHRVTGAELFVADVESGRIAQLTSTAERAEMEPAVSPDGRHVAFVDGRSGALLVATLPAAW